MDCDVISGWVGVLANFHLEGGGDEQYVKVLLNIVNFYVCVSHLLQLIMNTFSIMILA